MNDFKKALIKVAGDLSESEKAVKNTVLYKKSKKKYSKIIIIPAFVVVLFFTVALLLFPNEVDQRQADNMFYNDYLYDYFVGIEMMTTSDNEITEFHKENAFTKYVRIIGVEQLAKSYNLNVSEQEISERKNLTDQIMNKKQLQQSLSKVNLTIEQYEQYVRPKLIDHNIFVEKLNLIWLKDNPRMLPDFVTSYTNQLAEHYLLKHFEEQYYTLQKKYNVNHRNTIGVPKSGVIAAIEGNMLFFIQNSTFEELQGLSEEEKYRLEDGKFKSWIVNLDGIPVDMGDFVKVSIGRVYRSDSENSANALNEGLEVILPMEDSKMIPKIQLAQINVAQWNELLDDVSWEFQEVVNNFSKPLYIVEAGGKTYTIFKNDYKNLLIVPYGEAKIAKVTQGRTEKIEEFLQPFLTK
ncbi:hypothetical protein H9635_10500 [Solibacillus sp. A46]|uniref:Uncharacterized protein n=1 Tax=Solibacillus faecavium TaxID=2762221 RepID=A0ABR8XYZ4_9BACL|nr:hypothetical protein [Solibacillus faecavium]MBD8037177.1 hypothetical protein [Solibacillus faecavium]